MMITLQDLHVRVPVREGTGPHCLHGETRVSSGPQPLSGGSGWSAGGLRRVAQFSSPGSRSHWFRAAATKSQEALCQVSCFMGKHSVTLCLHLNSITCEDLFSNEGAVSAAGG